MTFLQGVLADREKWSAVGQCAIEKTMAVVGTKSAMLIMREAYYGTTRFDDFAKRVGITKAASSARLAELVEAGEIRSTLQQTLSPISATTLEEAHARLRAGHTLGKIALQVWD